MFHGGKTLTMIQNQNICRVCSSQGFYSIFDFIPKYLNNLPNEINMWTKQIYVLLEEVTGIKIEENDGLPSKICNICISYLKHASVFRQQAIDNILSLKKVQNLTQQPPFLQQNNVDHYLLKNKICDDNEKDIFKVDLNDNNKTDINSFATYVLNNQSKNADYSKKVLNKKKKLHFFSDDHLGNKTQNSNVDDKKVCNNIPTNFDIDKNENNNTQATIFGYDEKIFEEDDIMSYLKEEENLLINIPEQFNERKCSACLRRFMFDESFKEHTELCIENKFLLFIENVNRLLAIRRNKNISPHEYIRRMIFCFKKTCKWLCVSYGENVLSDILSNYDPSKKNTSECYKADNSSCCKSDDNINSKEENQILHNYVNKKELIINSSINKVDKSERENEDPLLTVLVKNLQKSLDTNSDTKDIKNVNVVTSTPISAMISNKKTLEENQTSLFGVRKSLLKKFNQIASDSDYLSSCSIKSTKTANSFLKPKFSAKCKECDLKFNDISSLEKHNAEFHNSTKLNQQQLSILLEKMK